MARRLPFLVVLVALVVPLALAGQPAAVQAAGDAPPIKALTAQSLEEPQTYIITLEHPALARYRGGIDGLAGTSNDVTGAAKLDVNSPPSQAYLSFLAQRRGEFLQRLSERLAREVEIGYIYDVVLNGLTVKLTPVEAARVADLPGLVRISPREKRQLLTDRGPQWIGAPAAWGSATSCAAGGNCGEGIVIGVVDTGINMDHPSFADVGGDGYNHTNPLGAGNYKGWCNPTHPNYNSNYKCNDKLIGVYSYPNSDNNPEDPDGHGSHTASTAGGNRLPNMLLDEPTIDLPFDISGVAPHANIIAYDACTTNGCNNDDLIAALNQAATDQVDALNYSISGSGLSPWVAEDEQAFLGLRNAGAFVSASAGNSGPDAQTVAHGSPWMTTTAASTHDRALINAAINLTSSNGPLAGIYGRSVTGPLGSTPMIYAGNVKNNPLCLSGVWSASDLAGKLVVCDRGNNARVEKAENVQKAGGAGMILVNAASNGDEEIGDAYVIPGVHITYNEGVMLKNWLAAGSGHTGGILGTQNDINANNGDVMAAFSSRGPNAQVPDLIKPDMTAPGVDILAAWATLQGEPVPELEIISGTSMSSPHMAGAGALMMKAKYPGWTVAEIQSAMMTTSLWDNTVRKEDGITPTNPFDRGAGRVNIANALNAGLVMNITSAEYDAANPAATPPGDPKTLNYPSMADDACYKSCGWTRTVRNTLGQAVMWNGQFIGKDGLAGSLTVPNFTINAGATQQLGVSISDVSGLTPGKWYFGHVVYTAQGNVAPQFHMPVAIRVAASTDAGMIEKTVTPTGAGTGAQLSYTVTVKNKASSSRTFNVSDPVPAGSTFVSGSNSSNWSYNSGTNTLSGSATLGAASFVWREKNLSGYDPMAGRVPAADLAGVNLDNGCFSLGGMDFYYLDTHYTQILVSMNGVVRAGIPTSPLCPTGTPTKFPTNDPGDMQENLLAPFWADLDLTGGNMYLVLTVFNGKPHTVIEWENIRLKANNQRFSFQIWFEDGSDNIWFAYPAGFNTMVGTTSPTAGIGAENLAGSAGVQYYFYSGSGTKTGNVPDGSKDIWVGLEPTSAVFTFKANATAGANSNITNEATTTVSSTTNKAWANTRICGAATATQPKVSIQSKQYPLVEWAGSVFDSFELWRSTSPYVGPTQPGSIKVFEGKTMSFIDMATAGVGNPGLNYFYVLRTKNCAGTSTADSAGVAEFDFALVKGQ
jgi:uncharacterized repeat protein (TIGR01451 family)